MFWNILQSRMNTYKKKNRLYFGHPLYPPEELKCETNIQEATDGLKIITSSFSTYALSNNTS
jgi:hypothetical protein